MNDGKMKRRANGKKGMEEGITKMIKKSTWGFDFVGQWNVICSNKVVDLPPS